MTSRTVSTVPYVNFQATIPAPPRRSASAYYLSSGMCREGGDGVMPAGQPSSLRPLPRPSVGPSTSRENRSALPGTSLLDAHPLPLPCILFCWPSSPWSPRGVAGREGTYTPRLVRGYKPSCLICGGLHTMHYCFAAEGEPVPPPCTGWPSPVRCLYIPAIGPATGARKPTTGVGPQKLRRDGAFGHPEKHQTVHDDASGWCGVLDNCSYCTRQQQNPHPARRPIGLSTSGGTRPITSGWS